MFLRFREKNFFQISWAPTGHEVYIVLNMSIDYMINLFVSKQALWHFDSPTKLYDAGLWLGMSDHRPLIVSFAVLPAQTLRPRFTLAYSQARSSQLRCFRPSPNQIQNFQEALTANWVRLDESSRIVPSAEAQPGHLAAISPEASSTLKKLNIRGKYKNTGVWPLRQLNT